MKHHLLQDYLHDLHMTHATGAAVKETSYYGALANLLNGVGATLKPKVRCILHPQNRGAGIPDGGLFTQDQWQTADEGALQAGQVPARGVVEVKGTGENVTRVAGSEQVAKYFARYRQVLVTNYRDFALVIPDSDGQPIIAEAYSLAETEPAFWRAAANPAEQEALHGERFADYLRRVIVHPAPLTSPEDVAWILASFAREAKGRIAHAKLRALDVVRLALEQSLGMKFDGDQGDHFFRSTLIQTLFYGVFSAWVLWSKRQFPTSTARFDWRNAAWELHVPMIRALFEQVVMPGKLGPLHLVEVLDWTGDALNRVVRADFFARFEEDQAVQYFYEPFLEAFDPELRRQLGVWYTPTEVVRYMVARVDAALREDLGIAGGLADPSVVVLDPCCGTGAFLVETLKYIHASAGGDALAGQDVKQAAMQRVFGFELLPAPFVVAHLQLGLMLQRLGAPLVGKMDERVGVYLTNALTGWEPSTEPKKLVLFPELESEHDASERIKQEERVLVILGNPPYNGFAGVAVDEERDLSQAYRATKAAPKPQGQGLNDLYVRFFRMAERRIVERTGQGIVCYISNYSWLDGLSFPGMRERYMEVFDTIRIDCLNGDKYKTGKLTPEGDPDPSVFSTEFNREGIQVGTAIVLLTRHASHQPASSIAFRHFWGRNKRQQLLDATSPDLPPYRSIVPAVEMGLPFAPMRMNTAYSGWPLLAELFGVMSSGVNTSRDLDLVAIDEETLRGRMELYFDAACNNAQLQQIGPSLMTPSGRYDPVATRQHLLQRGIGSGFFVRYAYRPFDTRRVYWHPETKLLDEKREDLFATAHAGNLFLTSRQKAERLNEGTPFYVTPHLPDRHLTRPGSVCFPLTMNGVPKRQSNLFEEPKADAVKANLSEAARSYLAALGIADPDSDMETASLIWMHALAIGSSLLYLSENEDALKQDWPRIPLPSARQQLEASAALGRMVARLMNTDTAVPGVTTGKIRPELAVVGNIARSGGGQLDIEAGELAITAHWGSAGQGGVTMPGKGKLIERDYTPAERAALGEAEPLLGAPTCDVYLNNVAFWSCVPVRVWKYTVGGYQVMKKWLSYREQDLLGRALRVEEAREVTAMARRIAAILLLEQELDANYRAVQSAL